MALHFSVLLVKPGSPWSERECHFEGIVIEDPDTKIFARVLFMQWNDITIRLAKDDVFIEDTQFKYG